MVGLYLVFGSTKPNVQSENQPSRTVTIPMNNYTGGSFDKRGPVIEMRNSVPASVWMHNIGEINYQFTTPNPRPSGDCSISTMLSSEVGLELEKADDPNLTSDVTLRINNKEPPSATKNVIKDGGGISSRYTWVVPAGMVENGTNTITFAVKPDAQHPNGITIHGPITVEFR